MQRVRQWKSLYKVRVSIFIKYLNLQIQFLSEDPTITVTVTAGVATPMAGSMYSLNCTVTGAEGLTDSTTNYQWYKNGEVVSDQTVETLSFTSLSFSDAGGYTCQATVMSNLLSGPITMSSTNTVEVHLTCKCIAGTNIAQFLTLERSTCALSLSLSFSLSLSLAWFTT